MTLIQNKRKTIILFSIGLILLLPLIAMQFTNEVNWSGFDFIVAGILLSTIGIAIELVFKLTKSNKQRIILLAVVLVLGFLIWAELAVGVFGTPFAGN